MRDEPEDRDGDPLAGIDLGAWQAPPPPTGLAERVIAATQAAPATAAVAPPPSPPPSPSRPRWLVGGAVTALTAAAAATAILVGRPAAPPRQAADERGALTAAAPRRVELGGIAIDLEAAAEVRWRRDRAGLHVTQPAGTATYVVAPDDHLWIDAGATVASVEATGASLRVEVPMKPELIPARAGAAVVAAATVTVAILAGHALVSGDRAAPVTVNAGATVVVSPDQPPREPTLVAGVPPASSPLTHGSRVLPAPAWQRLRVAIGEDVDRPDGLLVGEPVIVDSLRERVATAIRACATELGLPGPSDDHVQLQVDLELQVTGARGLGSILELPAPTNRAAACLATALANVELPPIGGQRGYLAMLGPGSAPRTASIEIHEVPTHVTPPLTKGYRVLGPSAWATLDHLHAFAAERGAISLGDAVADGATIEAAARLAVEELGTRSCAFAARATGQVAVHLRGRAGLGTLVTADGADTLGSCLATALARVELPSTNPLDVDVDVEVRAARAGNAVRVATWNLRSSSSAAELGAVIQTKAGIYRACYQRELTHTPGLGGKLVVELTIAASGKVMQTRTVSDTLGSRGVEDCVRSSLATLVFPAKGGAVVSYPFEFSPAPTAPHAKPACQPSYAVDPFDPRPVCPR
jgi:hypothetical protein